MCIRDMKPERVLYCDNSSSQRPLRALWGGVETKSLHGARSDVRYSSNIPSENRTDIYANNTCTVTHVLSVCILARETRMITLYASFGT